MNEENSEAPVETPMKEPEVKNIAEDPVENVPEEPKVSKTEVEAPKKVLEVKKEDGMYIFMTKLPTHEVIEKIKDEKLFNEIYNNCKTAREQQRNQLSQINNKIKALGNVEETEELKKFVAMQKATEDLKTLGELNVQKEASMGVIEELNVKCTKMESLKPELKR